MPLFCRVCKGVPRIGGLCKARYFFYCRFCRLDFCSRIFAFKRLAYPAEICHVWAIYHCNPKRSAIYRSLPSNIWRQAFAYKRQVCYLRKSPKFSRSVGEIDKRSFWRLLSKRRTAARRSVLDAYFARREGLCDLAASDRSRETALRGGVLKASLDYCGNEGGV